jgi:hypothetical protein
VTRRPASIAVVVVAVALAAASFVTGLPAAAAAGTVPVAAVHAQDDDIPDQCRTIVGCADAGPKPEHPGDRGGYAQFLTLGALAAGVGFILFRIGRAVRTGPPTPPG